MTLPRGPFNHDNIWVNISPRLVLQYFSPCDKQTFWKKKPFSYHLALWSQASDIGHDWRHQDPLSCKGRTVSHTFLLSLVLCLMKRGAGNGYGQTIFRGSHCCLQPTFISLELQYLGFLYCGCCLIIKFLISTRNFFLQY